MAVPSKSLNTPDQEPAAPVQGGTKLTPLPASDETIDLDALMPDMTGIPTLEELLAGITPENLHPEIDWGPDVGNEIIPPYEN
jgi:antitoxin component of MazEF toxin-antitoxin module